MSCGSAFTICPIEDVTSPTPDQDLCQPPPPLCTDQTPEPTTDGEPEPAAMKEPGQRTEPTTTPEPEHHSESDQVCKPATSSVPVGLLVEYEGMDESPVQSLASEFMYYDELEEHIYLNLLPLLVLPSSKSPASPEIPPSLLLPPPLPKPASPWCLPPLVPFSSSAPSLSTPQCCVDAPQIFRTPAPAWK